jgi:ketosteroid isomerase-like protein
VASATATAEPPPPAPPKPSLAELIPQVLKGLDEAFNAHDAKKFASYDTEDVLVTNYGASGEHGRADAEKFFQSLFDAFPDAKSATMRVWIKSHVAIWEIGWTGTMTSDFMGMKATKKAVGGLRVNVGWFNDDGSLRELHTYADGAGMMAQIQGKPNAPPPPVLPSNPPDVHVAKGTPEEDKLVDWAKGIDDAFNKGDIKAAVALHADDADAWLSFSGKPAMKGTKELTKGVTDIFKTFPDQKWTSTNVWSVDGFAISEKVLTGTQKGKLGPFPPSNKPVTWHWLEIVQPNADGKIAHAWLYANIFEALMQTGALKAPGEKPAAKAAAPKAEAPAKK